MRIWILTNAASPYQVEFLTAIHDSNRIRLDVRFMRRRYPGQKVIVDPAGKFEHRFLRAWAPDTWNDMFRLHPGVWKDLRSDEFDLYILSGVYTSPTFLLSALRLKRIKKPWALWLEQPWPEDYRPSWADKKSPRNAVVRYLRKHLLLWLMKSATAVFCIGTAARDVYRQFGLKDDQAYILPYFCDTTRYQNVADKDRQAIVNRYNLEGKTVFLYSGLLTERKGVDCLIPAFEKIGNDFPETILLVLGDGKLRHQLETSVKPEARNKIHFSGFIPQKDLPAYYAAADVFVFPSRHDGWGVVINEACAAGLPVIATRQTGAARDLVVQGHNGFLIERDREDQLVDKMRFFLEYPGEIKIYGEHSREIIAQYTLEKGVEMLEQAARQILSSKGK